MANAVKIFEVLYDAASGKHLVSWPITSGHKAWCEHESKELTQMLEVAARLKAESKPYWPKESSNG